MSYAVGLQNPKNSINVGHVLRAATAYGCALVAVQGKRMQVRAPSDTSYGYNKFPVIRCDNLHDVVPFDHVPVAIEFNLGNSISLVDFEHPKNAFYIFGPEDSSLGKSVLTWCKHTIYVPTQICMNLSACVNVVLYDRLAKELSRARNEHRSC